MTTIANTYPGPNVHVTVFDTAVIAAMYPEWPALDRDERYHLLTGRPARRAITREDRTSNVTCIGLHNFLATAMDPEVTDIGHASDLAVGTGGASGVDASDTAMNDPLGTTPVTDTVSSDGGQLQVTTFIDSSQFNNETLDEIGVLDDSVRLWNHAVLSPDIEKTASKIVVVDVFFTIQTGA